MKRMRYEYLLDIIKVVKPENIIEIGVAKGDNAVKMIQTAGFNVEYTGFDVFDWSDKEWHKLVGNGKKVLDENGFPYHEIEVGPKTVKKIMKLLG